MTVLIEVADERKRQIAKGYDLTHDDSHTNGSIARAAAAYALAGQGRSQDGALIWPWEISTFRPEDRRSSLIKSAALCIAEIERLDLARYQNCPCGGWDCSALPQGPMADCPYQKST